MPRTRLLLLLALATVPTGLVALGTLTSFSNGTLADASAINANFTTLGTAVQTLETNAVRVVRKQAAMGTLNCGGTVLTVPGAVTFQGKAGEWVTVEALLSGRANANGHLYGNLKLNGVNLTRFSAPSYHSGGDWVRTMNGLASVQLTTTGTQTFTTTIECGNGMSSYGDLGGEWPLGGASYRVTIGG